MMHEGRLVAGTGPSVAVAPRRRWRGVAVFLAAAVTLYFGGPVLLRRLDYFHVRRVEIVGARYVSPGAIRELLDLDTTRSVWDRLGPIEERVATHPQVGAVDMSRRLPGTLVVRIVENLPVALVATAEGLHPYDRNGRALPIDPARTLLDLPIVARGDTAALRLLDELRAAAPALFGRVSEVLRDDLGGLRVLMSGTTVRALADCTVDRLLEIVPIEKDLARRGHRAAELDLRYRDQIVARIE